MADSTVDWQAVRGFVHRLLVTLDHKGLPVAGTSDWRALDDQDPRKVAAVLCAGSRWALETEIAQIRWRRDALKRASIVVSQGADWTAVARRVRDRDASLRNGAYIPRKAS